MADPETLVLDVRDDIRAGREPFQRIMAAVQSLQPGQTMALINLFEHVPLYTVMDRRGFDHRAERTPEGDWQVLFVPRPADS
ncbi:MAG: DUF2249 domain-containing protein [Dehalococcoidia bacterium]|nr:DUF2249 domain-containing protein [Dehalococcoidia bacterium]